MEHIQEGGLRFAQRNIRSGKILAVDIKEMDKIKNVSILECNFLEKNQKKILDFFEKKIDVIISDMAANTTGNKALDCIRTNQLCTDVIEFSDEILKKKAF